MSDDMSFDALSAHGLRITNSRDLEQARWLVKVAGSDAVQLAALELSSRRMPRPRKVIVHLGLERRVEPRPDVSDVMKARCHSMGRRDTRARGSGDLERYVGEE